MELNITGLNSVVMFPSVLDTVSYMTQKASGL